MRTFIFIFALLVFVSQASAATEDEFLKLGNECLNAGKYDKAVKAFTRAVSVNPSNPEAQKGLGIAYFNIGDNGYAINPEVLGKSVGALFEAARISPDSESLYYLGSALLDLGYIEDSMDVYNVLQKVDPNKANLLSVKIANFKEPDKYRYLRNEHNMNEERKEYLRAVAEQERQEQFRVKQEKIAAARAEQEERQRMISAIENARRAAEEAAHRAAMAEAAAGEAKADADRARRAASNPIHVPSGGHVIPGSGGQIILY